MRANFALLNPTIMKIVVTGSLGHISKPLVQDLVAQGHAVTVISSKADKTQDIENIGAIPAIGKLQDAAFLTQIFSNADAVYLMEPPGNYRDPDFDMRGFWIGIAESYARAVKDSGVKRIVHLSSIGAHTNQGNGMLAYHYEVEQILRALPQDIDITFMRPVGFYYNLMAFLPMIKSQQAIFTNYKPDYPEPWVAPEDIAKATAQALLHPVSGRTVRYVASDALTGDQVAQILGEALQVPNLQWIRISDQAAFEGMVAGGLNPQRAKGLVEMNAARQDGSLFKDYFQNIPVLGGTKLRDYAVTLAEAYCNLP